MTTAESSVASMIGASFSGAGASTGSAIAVDGFEFAEEFQTKIAALAVRDDEFMRRMSHLIKPDYFENAGEAALVNIALKHYQKYRCLPDHASMGLAIKAEIDAKVIRRDVLALVIEARKAIVKHELRNREFVEDQVVEFVRHQAVSQAIYSSVDLLARKKFDKIEADMRAAIEIGKSEDGTGYNYFQKVKERTEIRLEVASGKRPPRGITSGVAKLDELLYHKGWGRKELVTIMGGPKAGKCVTRDTLIFTGAGLAEIGKFVPSSVEVNAFTEHVMDVLGMEGIEKTSHVYNSGMTPTIRVKTTHGLFVEGTHHHPMLTLSKDGEHVWKNLDEIKLGDFIVGQRGDRVYGSNVDLSHAVAAGQQRQTESKRPDAMAEVLLPSVMTPDLAEWLAMTIAEGYCGDKGTISFTQKDEVVLRRFVELTKGLFGLNASVVHHKDKTPSARVTNVCLKAYLEAMGVNWCNSVGKSIPESVLCAPRECVLSFLRALLGLEGNVRAVSASKVVYDLAMASKTIIRQAQMLLLNEGVISNYSERESCATNGSSIMRPYYRLQVSGSRNLIGLRTIGLYEARKDAVLATAVVKDAAARDWLPNQRQLVGKVMNEFQVCGKPLKSTLDPSFGCALRRARSGCDGEVRHLTFALAEKLLSAVDANSIRGAACDRLRELVNGRHFYAEVQEIAHGEAETVDLTVPGTHSFFANGLVSHNTTALINFAKSASLAGYNVLYVTLEVGAAIISDRLDACLSDTTMKDLLTKIHGVRERIEELQAKAGKLILHEYASGTMTPNMLRKLIERYKSPTWVDGEMAPPIKFDLIVADYADIMAPNFRTQDAIENSKSVYVDLRAIAFEEDVAMLTATQTNRVGSIAAVAKAEHVAEDFNKVRTVDLMISINKTEEEARDGIARLYFAASRNQEAGFTIVIKQDLSMMQFVKSVLRVE
jgi:intein/homing endonuclease